jgi:hypothetical protein
MRVRWDTDSIAKRDLAKFFLFNRENLPEAESLLRQGADARDPWSHLLLGVLLEHRDGRSARKHLRAAKRRSEGTPEEFSEELRAFREAWQVRFEEQTRDSEETT